MSPKTGRARRLLCGGVVLAAFALFAVEGCSKTCTLRGCAEEGVIVTANVRRPVEELKLATMTTCYNGTCTSSRPADTLDETARRWSGGFITQRTEGWTSIRLFLSTPEDPIEDGDQLRVTIVGAGGERLLDVERALTVRPLPNPNGPGCGDECRFALATLYPESRSGLKCDNGSVDAEISLELSLRSVTGYDPNATRLTVCRNALCARTARVISLSDGTMEGDDLGASFSGGGDKLRVRMDVLPSVLRDDDRYSMKLVNGRTGETLYAAERAASYETSYPNGRDCDVHPKRKKVVLFD
ncbi:MAG: hypothetical protein JST00_47050 [Deltaproteobacteria bacterium]|nr:hypothetical protein [Deltaproteobacteria bacterium]